MTIPENTIVLSVTGAEFHALKYGTSKRPLFKRINKKYINLFCGVGSSVFPNFSQVTEFKPRQDIKFVKIVPQGWTDKRDATFELDKIELTSIPIGKGQIFSITLGKLLP